MRRVLVLSLTHVLLWFVVAELNHLLTGLRIYLFVGALYVVFAALQQPFRSGFATALIGGWICDANASVAFGMHALLFAAAHVSIFHLRDRVPRDDTTAAVLIALMTNLALFLVFSFAQIHDSPAPAAIWPRLLADLLCSQIFLALIGPWFFALQSRALILARVDRESLA